MASLLPALVCVVCDCVVCVVVVVVACWLCARCVCGVGRGGGEGRRGGGREEGRSVWGVCGGRRERGQKGRGVHSTTTFMNMRFTHAYNSMSTAHAGDVLVINLLSADPFPRLSVHVGATVTFSFPDAGCSPLNVFKATSTANASSVAMIREGLPPFSCTQGRTSRVISALNKGDSQGRRARSTLEAILQFPSSSRLLVRAPWKRSLQGALASRTSSASLST